MTDHHDEHQHQHDHSNTPTKSPVEPAEWDEMYADAERVWSGNPNIALVTDATGLAPGTAVDVGCGEGADAIWLAEQGWRVTGFDVSTVALDRAAEHAADRGVAVELHRGGLLDVDLPRRPFDLVNVHYGVLKHEEGRSLATLLDLVAPGGTLLFVHHADLDSDEVRSRGLDIADYLMPPDVHAALDDGWDVQFFGERPREVETGRGAGHHADVVLRARRK
jgi:2-polyprenyl-3-methyl-5-hydroxy-6-metoxy-1,4-benzoquinol methylase